MSCVVGSLLGDSSNFLIQSLSVSLFERIVSLAETEYLYVFQAFALQLLSQCEISGLIQNIEAVLTRIS